VLGLKVLGLKVLGLKVLGLIVPKLNMSPITSRTVVCVSAKILDAGHENAPVGRIGR
jgi:hypothetical protein